MGAALPFVLSAAGLMLTALVHALLVARWTGEVRALVPLIMSEIALLRSMSLEHGEAIARLDAQVRPLLEAHPLRGRA